MELARTVHPDILISDVAMLEMTGFELAIAVTEIVPEYKILLFSCCFPGRERPAEKALHREHDFTILTKPVHPTDMLRRISECLERRKTSFEPIPSSADNRPRTSRASQLNRVLRLQQVRREAAISLRSVPVEGGQWVVGLCQVDNTPSICPA